MTCQSLVGGGLQFRVVRRLDHLLAKDVGAEGLIAAYHSFVMKRRQTKFGSIAVALEECTVVPGGMVCGDVVVEVQKPVPAFTGVVVGLRGTVSTRLSRGSGETSETYFDVANGWYLSHACTGRTLTNHCSVQRDEAIDSRRGEGIV